MDKNRKILCVICKVVKLEGEMVCYSCLTGEGVCRECSKAGKSDHSWQGKPKPSEHPMYYCDKIGRVCDDLALPVKEREEIFPCLYCEVGLDEEERRRRKKKKVRKYRT